MIFFIGLAASGLLAFFLYKFFKLLNFFNDRNIPYVPAVWPLGSDVRAALFLDNFGVSWKNIYDSMPQHKIVGFYNYMTPVVMVRDPEYVHRVFISDFGHFVDRGFGIDEKKDPLDGHIFFLGGDKWRFLRAKLSPVFTSGKLKWMFEQMKTCSDKFVNNFDKKESLNAEVELKEAYARLATDVITSCAFGVDSNAMGDVDSRFREVGKAFVSPSIYNTMVFMARLTMPKLLSILNLRTIPTETNDFFVNFVKSSMDHRKKTGYVRKDFVQLLLELREKGSVQSYDTSLQNELASHINKIPDMEINDSVLTAQLFLFFVAGFETTSSTLLYTTQFLAMNQDCQDKVRAEVKQVLERHGDFTYDSLKDLKYLDNCIKETLRLCPIVAHQFRKCTKDYTFPNGVKIDAGQFVVIPTFGLHLDPKYFKEPVKYKPERFDEPIEKGVYAPFGDGPRICIGKRFAEVEMKLTLAKLILKYKFSPGLSKPNMQVLDPISTLFTPKSPLKVNISKLQE